MDNPVYIFDGDCILCSRSVRYMLKYEKEPDTRFVAIQSGEGRKIALRHGLDPDNPQSFLYIAGSKAFQKSDALIEIARRVTGPAAILRGLAVLPRPLRDWLYLRIAKHRYKIFGRKSNCMVPQAENAHRFILT